MKTYTEKIHAKRLKAILKRNNTCDCCPAGKNYSGTWNKREIWSNWEDTCKICRAFIGLRKSSSFSDCPCHALGPKKALKRTWIALEKKGYLP